MVSAVDDLPTLERLDLGMLFVSSFAANELSVRLV